MNDASVTCPETTTAGVAPIVLLEPWLKLCAGNPELLAQYDRLRGTEGRFAMAEGRCTAFAVVDGGLLKNQACYDDLEALGFFDWCRDTFERLGWD